jgi:hypothetical protein|tara:strand:- start:350 stop:808 length:459 start_codon:yes stop_codon:yes gene_type:complete
MQGFASNDGDVSAITGSSFVLGKAIKLHADTTVDAKSSALPSACYLSHIDLQLDATIGTPATVDAFLAWDAGGDSPMTGLAEGNKLWAGLTDANIDGASVTALFNTSIALDVWITSPESQTTQGACYLWIKVNAGTVTVKRARLHWALRETV